MFRTLAFAALVLAACNDAPPSGGSSNAPTAAPLDGSWSLVELNGRVVSRGVTLEFRDDNKVGGQAPCNSYFGNYATSVGSSLSLSQIGATRTACPDLQLESEYLTALGDTTRFAQGVDGQTLVLRVGSGVIVASYNRQNSTSAGIEGDWQIVTVLTSSGLERGPALAGAGMAFEAGNRFGGNLGCNNVGGEYRFEGDTLSFEQTLVTARACPGTATYDTEILRALPLVRRASSTPEGYVLQDDAGMTLIQLAR